MGLVSIFIVFVSFPCGLTSDTDLWMIEQHLAIYAAFAVSLSKLSDHMFQRVQNFEALKLLKFGTS